MPESDAQPYYTLAGRIESTRFLLISRIAEFKLIDAKLLVDLCPSRRLPDMTSRHCDLAAACPTGPSAARWGGRPIVSSGPAASRAGPSLSVTCAPSIGFVGEQQ